MPLSNPSSTSVTVNPSTTSSASTGTNVAASVTSSLLISANSSRKGLTLWNNSTANLFVDTASVVTATVFTAKINAGGYYELPFGYTGALYGVWDAANGSALIREFT